jgi:hypothetical protein
VRQSKARGMSSSVKPTDVTFSTNTMWVTLSDGRTLGAPLTWFPRLLHATQEQLGEYELSSRGLHWEALEEDVSVAGLLAGRGDQTQQPPLGSTVETVRETFSETTGDISPETIQPVPFSAEKMPALAELAKADTQSWHQNSDASVVKLQDWPPPQETHQAAQEELNRPKQINNAPRSALEAHAA